MAATKSQGSSFTLFMAGLTAACAGIAFFSSGAGKVSLILGLIALAYSFVKFLATKKEEGEVALKVQPAVLQLAGVAAGIFGWLVVLFGLHMSSTVPGRLTTTIVGLAITLIGVLYLLPKAASKNAIWKV